MVEALLRAFADWPSRGRQIRLFPVCRRDCRSCSFSSELPRRNRTIQHCFHAVDPGTPNGLPCRRCSGAVPAGRGAAFVTATVERGQPKRAVQTFLHHCSVSLMRLGGPPEGAVLFAPLDLTNHRPIAIPKSAQLLPNARSNKPARCDPRVRSGQSPAGQISRIRREARVTSASSP